MTTSKVEYLGGLRTECTHVKSGETIITDAPTDNNGKGEAFSPTDLVATAYASCMLTIVGIYCEKNKIPFVHASAAVKKTMVSNPRRIGKIEIDIDFSKNGWDKSVQEKIIRVGEACPVAKSVSDSTETVFTYAF